MFERQANQYILNKLFECFQKDRKRKATHVYSFIQYFIEIYLFIHNRLSTSQAKFCQDREPNETKISNHFQDEYLGHCNGPRLASYRHNFLDKSLNSVR